MPKDPLFFLVFLDMKPSSLKSQWSWQAIAEWNRRTATSRSLSPGTHDVHDFSRLVWSEPKGQGSVVALNSRICAACLLPEELNRWCFHVHVFFSKDWPFQSSGSWSCSMRVLSIDEIVLQETRVSKRFGQSRLRPIESFKRLLKGLSLQLL